MNSNWNFWNFWRLPKPKPKETEDKKTRDTKKDTTGGN